MSRQKKEFLRGTKYEVLYLFRQPQQVTQLFGKILNHNMLGIAKRQDHF
jgi:hypothetical protein